MEASTRSTGAGFAAVLCGGGLFLLAFSRGLFLLRGRLLRENGHLRTVLDLIAPGGPGGDGNRLTSIVTVNNPTNSLFSWPQPP